ncbi:TonB-dependent receptor domain-containing protein [Sphingobium sp.]|uniref:TonB-dependent receptor n=1 Tax=Sphingobium sp. TaxID=1912891 RepID=UPI0028BF282A|nr:TonB-dependent receptor [Sphingobium sp.]
MPAFAQDGSSTGTADYGLNDIVVTAQKRAENLQDVPIAISAVNADTMAASGVTNVSNLMVALPGVDFKAGNGFALPTIRGVASRAASPGFEAPVALYVDDVYYASQLSGLMSFNNVAQIAALKGPQGTLFGRNATAGLMQITTREPGQDLSAKIDLSYGNYETVRVASYVGGGLADDVAADLALSYQTMGKGYGLNRTTGNDVLRVNHDFGVRSKWVFTPADGTKVRLILDYVDQENSNNASRVPVGESTVPPFAPNFGGRPRDIEGRDPLIRHREGGFSLKIEQDIGSLQLVSITAKREGRTDITFDGDYTAVNARYIAFRQNDSQFSQEVQLLSPSGGPFTWVLGGYYFNGSNEYDSFNQYFMGAGIPAAGPLANAVHLQLLDKSKTNSISGFAQATAAITDRLKATAGIRYTSEKRSLVGVSQTLTFVNGTSATQIVPDRATRFGKATWRLALDYEISDDVLGYISYNRGFRSGGYNSNNITLPAFSPEVLDSYEIGLKTDFLDKRARLNLAAYYYDFKNIQVFASRDGQIAVLNSGNAKQYGLEADLQLRPVDRLTLTGSYQWVPTAKYLDFPAANIFTPRAAGGYNSLIGSATGNRLLLNPEHLVTASADYEAELGSNKLGFNVTFYHNGGFFWDPDNVIRQKAYSLVNASVRLVTDDQLTFSVWANNITDKEYTTNGGIQGFGPFGMQREALGPPRTYGVTLGYAF